MPASYCGVVGLKPTYGRVSRYGLVAFASSLDQIGPFTKTAKDAALITHVMSGKDEHDATSMDVLSDCYPVRSFKNEPLTIGVPREYFDGVSVEVEQAIKQAIAFYESEGAVIKEVSLPYSRFGLASYYVVALCEASSNLARFDGVRFGPSTQGDELDLFYKKNRALFGPEVKRRILLGTFSLSSGYADQYYDKACRVRRLIRDDFLNVFKQVDVLCSPVSMTPAFKFGAFQDPLSLYKQDNLTIPASLGGFPALSIPQSSGLPIGLQIIGPHFSESRLLSMAQHWENRHEGL